MTRVKICGLSRPQDVAYVNRARPDWCGFVVNFPKSRRSVTPDQLRSLRRELDPSVVPVGVFVDQPVEVVTDLLNRGIISIAQLHGGEDEDYTAALRAAAPGKEIWKAFQVHEPADLERAIAFPADRILLDSGQGTGRTFDWSLLRYFPRPYLLAGGLDPENLPTAIRTLHPYGVDLSSGVETDGLKDFTKIQAAVAPGKEIWKAFPVRGPADLERAIAFPADRILLDSGQGTGRTFDWSLLRHFPRPYLLAGGLDPENLPTAIRTLHPYGVDLSSGVETDGLKDFTKIQAAVAAAREE